MNLTLWYFLLLFLPGLCLIFLTGFHKKVGEDLQGMPLFWLLTILAFGLSLGLISVTGWAADILGLGFTGVRYLALGIVSLSLLGLIVIGLVGWKQGRVRSWTAEQNISSLFFTNPQFRIRSLFDKTAIFGRGLKPETAAGIIISVLVILVFLVTNRVGPWLSHTADSFNHLAAVASLTNYNNALPRQIYMPQPVPYPDPTFGSWHLALALAANLSDTGLIALWQSANILSSLLIVLSFALLAWVLTRKPSAMVWSTLLYLFIQVQFDFRVAAQPNRVGQVLFWLLVVLVVLAARQERSQAKKIVREWGPIVFLLAYGLGATHMQYPPAVVSLLVFAGALGLVPYVKFERATGKPGAQPERWGSRVRVDRTGFMSSNWMKYILVSGCAVVASIVVFAMKSASVLPDRSPLVASSSSGVSPTLIDRVMSVDLTFWFSSWLSPIVIASILALALVSLWYRKQSMEYTIILAAALLVPVCALSLTFLLGSGGLVATTIRRLALLMPPFLMIAWGIYLAKASSVFLDLLWKGARSFTTQFILPSLVIILSAVVIWSGVRAPGGVLSLYSSESTYKWRVSVSQEGWVVRTRRDAISAMRSLPEQSLILADAGVGYELAVLTDQPFFIYPSSHIPIQEKKNYSGNYDLAQKFLSGEMGYPEMVTVLQDFGIDYVYVDLRRYNGSLAWSLLPKLGVLEQVAGDREWRLYRHHPERAGAFLDFLARKTDSIPLQQKIELLQEVRAIFPVENQYLSLLSGEFNITGKEALHLVELGTYYQTIPAPNVVYNFLNHFDDAQINKLDKTADIQRSVSIVFRKAKGVIYQHPTSELAFDVEIPANAILSFSVTLSPDVWHLGQGDGVEYYLYLEDDAFREIIFYRYINPKMFLDDQNWLNYEIDLSAYAGKTVGLIFVTQPGPNGDAHYDWAVWGEPRLLQPLYYDFLEKFSAALITGAENGSVSIGEQTIGNEIRPIIFQHPTSQITYSLELPQKPVLSFGFGMPEEVWLPEKGDGIVYNVYVRTQEEPHKLLRVFHQYIDPKNNPSDRRWFDARVDLTLFSGQTVDIVFETLPGPEGNSYFDWGSWSSPVVLDETPP